MSTPACRIHSSAREGSVAESSFFVSAQTRSAESVESLSLARAKALRPSRIRPAGTVMGEETEEAQDAQVILGDPLGRLADKAHGARVDIRQPFTRSITAPCIVRLKRVDRQIPPLGIRLPIGAEGDLGAPPVRLDIAAQRRHLERVGPR